MTGKPLGSRTTAIEALQGADLSGKVAIVTGANSGIGVETVRALTHAGADVILCSRDPVAGERAAETIRSGDVKGKITVKQLDLADFSSIKAFADSMNKELSRLDLLILNAGVMACPLMRTKQGFEMQIGVNHIGHFYLTSLLLPKLKESGTAESPSRVVSVSSLAHTFGQINVDDLNYDHRRYYAWGSYGQSKLANVLFARELARRMEAENSHVKAYSLHPGAIKTNLQRHMGWMNIPFSLFSPLLKTQPQGAATSMYAATAPGIPSGAYLVDCKEAQSSAAGRDMKLAAVLWDKTEELVNKAVNKN